jgi:hypothetical protein
VFDNPQFILSGLSLIVTVAAGIAGYIYFRRTRKYKELSYEISPTVSLVSVGSAVKDRVVIKYKYGDQQTEDLGIGDLEAVAVTIHSTGTEAVRFPPSSDPQLMDTQIPVTLDFGRSARILGEPSAETSPKGRPVEIRRDAATSGKVLMEKFLLNPRDSVTISTFLAGFSEERPRVDWHIENVRPPQELKRRPWALILLLLSMLSISTVFLVTVAVFWSSGVFAAENDTITTWALLSSFFGIVGTVLGAYFGIRTTSDAARAKDR